MNAQHPALPLLLHRKNAVIFLDFTDVRAASHVRLPPECANVLSEQRSLGSVFLEMSASEMNSLRRPVDGMFIFRALDVACRHYIEYVMFCPFGAMAAILDVGILAALFDRNNVLAVQQTDGEEHHTCASAQYRDTRVQVLF